MNLLREFIKNNKLIVFLSLNLDSIVNELLKFDSYLLRCATDYGRPYDSTFRSKYYDELITAVSLPCNHSITSSCEINFTNNYLVPCNATWRESIEGPARFTFYGKMRLLPNRAPETCPMNVCKYASYVVFVNNV